MNHETHKCNDRCGIVNMLQILRDILLNVNNYKGVNGTNTENRSHKFNRV